MIKILSNREKLVSYIAAGAVAAVIGMNFIVAPIMGRNSTINKQIAASQNKLKEYASLLRQKDKITSRYQKYSPAQTSGQKEDGANDLAELENLANVANIRVIEMRPESSKNQELYKESVIGLKTRGGIEGYLRFVYDLENSTSLFRITRLQLTAISGSPELDGNFSITKISPR